VPVEDDFDEARLAWRPADRPARLRLVADAYGLDRDGRAELLTAIDDAIDTLEARVRRHWWTDHHDQFAAALAGPDSRTAPSLCLALSPLECVRVRRSWARSGIPAELAEVRACR
jgi:hypothetical protein